MQTFPYEFKPHNAELLKGTIHIVSYLDIEHFDYLVPDQLEEQQEQQIPKQQEQLRVPQQEEPTHGQTSLRDSPVRSSNEPAMSAKRDTCSVFYRTELRQYSDSYRLWRHLSRDCPTIARVSKLIPFTWRAEALPPKYLDLQGLRKFFTMCHPTTLKDTDRIVLYAGESEVKCNWQQHAEKSSRDDPIVVKLRDENDIVPVSDPWTTKPKLNVDIKSRMSTEWIAAI